MNWFDKAIALVAPERALQRRQARQALDMVRAYEGARTGRRTDGWITSSASANAEIGPQLARLRDRARDLERNNPWARRAITLWQSYLVGDGIACTIDGPDRLQLLFARWCDQCDADGRTDFYGLQSLATRHVARDGEVLIRRRWRRPEDGLPVPLQIQLLEPDFLDTARIDQLANGNTIVQGVEFGPLGRVVAYWLFENHPGDMIFRRGSLQSRRVPASEVLHVFDVERAAQARGVSWLSPVILKLRDADDYYEAEIVRKKIEACLSAFVTRDAGATSPLIQKDATAGDDGRRIEEIATGLMVYLDPGEKIETAEPKPIGGVADMMRLSAQMVAVGTDLPYELVTGDLGNVNYSSMRGGFLPFGRQIRRRQWHMLVPQLCNPLFAWFAEAARLAGAPGAATATAEWHPPRLEYVDPSVDIAAERDEIRNGFDTMGAALARRGTSLSQYIARRRAEQEQLDAAGIVLDSDPRRTSIAGNAQQANTAAGKPPPRPATTEK